MSRNPLLEVRKNKYLNLVARELLLSEGQNLEQTVTLISKKLNINKEKIWRFVEYLYRSNLLVKSKEKFGFTLEGVSHLLSLVESFYFTQDLKGEDDGHTGS
jgi:predicted transcriptional regulator